ncbi:Ig-like domain-containing protein [Exiguobacterium sp. SL14]|nr:Ig-like domain-containing protein [Exiguobacterium sp. SL14]MCY1689869.1 Ig-like domain-containing protein [Exiguobacterium sp. SL14]
MKHAGGSKYAVKKLTLPTKVKVKLSNGKYEMRSVKWSGSVKFEKKYINKYQVLYGKVAGTTKKAVLKVELQNYPVDVLEPVLEASCCWRKSSIAKHDQHPVQIRYHR